MKDYSNKNELLISKSLNLLSAVQTIFENLQKNLKCLHASFYSKNNYIPKNCDYIYSKLEIGKGINQNTKQENKINNQMNEENKNEILINGLNKINNTETQLFEDKNNDSNETQILSILSNQKVENEIDNTHIKTELSSIKNNFENHDLINLEEYDSSSVESIKNNQFVKKIIKSNNKQNNFIKNIRNLDFEPTVFDFITVKKKSKSIFYIFNAQHISTNINNQTLNVKIKNDVNMQILNILVRKQRKQFEVDLDVLNDIVSRFNANQMNEWIEHNINFKNSELDSLIENIQSLDFEPEYFKQLKYCSIDNCQKITRIDNNYSQQQKVKDQNSKCITNFKILTDIYLKHINKFELNEKILKNKIYEMKLKQKQLN